jgi:aryl-alcohol dehydrogenase-like predicted oxidoreductase
MYVGMQTLMPTHSDAMCQVFHVRSDAGEGARSSFVRRPVGVAASPPGTGPLTRRTRAAGPGKYRSAPDKGKSIRGGRMDKYMEGKGPAVLAALDAIAEKHGATPAQIALAWVMAKPAIAAPIASATSIDQLSELMGALKVSLSNDDIGVLDAAGA